MSKLFFCIGLTVLILSASCTTNSYFTSESAEARYLRRLVVEQPKIPPLRMWLLVDGGADPLGQNPEGEYLMFHVAKHLQNYNAFEAMIERSNVDVLYSDDTNTNALHYAAQYNNSLEFVQSLETEFPERLYAAPEGKSLLHLAALNNSNEVINYFVERGEDVNGTTDKGETPLFLAVKNARMVETVSLLEDLGADRFTRDLNNNTLAHAAAYSDSQELIDYLRSKDIDFQARNDDNDTILHIAARKSESIEFLHYLFRTVPYVSSPNEDDKSPLQILQDRFDYQTITYILLLDDEQPDTFFAQEQQNIIYELYTYFVLNQHDDTVTPQHLRDLVSLVEYENLAFNDTPLIHYAVRSFDTPEMLELLLEVGASLTETDYYGETVLHWAARYSSNPNTIAFILQYAPELVSVEEKLNKNLPIHYAAEFGSLPVFLLLAREYKNLNDLNAIGQSPRLLIHNNRNLYGSPLIWAY